MEGLVGLTLFAVLGFGFFVLVMIFKALRVVNEFERGVVFRLGRVDPNNVKQPGLRLLLPFLDKMVKVDMRTVTLDVPPQEVISKDNVTIKVNAVIYFNVMNATDAVIKIANYYTATSLYAQTTLRNILGQHELDEILAEREKIGHALQEIIDQATDAWGIKVTAVEIKDIELPEVMRRAMAKQAEAERERRAKIIAAEGEFQAAQRLQEAAGVLALNPAAIQLRYLQTLVEIGMEQNTTVVFPLPMDLLKGLQQFGNLGAAVAEAAAGPNTHRIGGSGA
ncbi:MAG: slipin family protein [Polyangiaceae bacterium]